MKLSFKALMGIFLKEERMSDEVIDTSMSVRKDEHGALDTSDKLSCHTPHAKGGTDKLTFFKIDEKTVEDFRKIYYSNTRNRSLSKILAFFDMLDIFQIVPASTISLLEDSLVAVFVS